MPAPARQALTVVQLLPALDGGGVERSTVEIVQALGRAGHRAVVISAGGRLQTDIENAGGEHIRLDIGRKSPLALARVLSLRRLLRRLRPDIVHARSRLPAWLARLALRGWPRADRPRFITTAHGLHSVNRYSAVMASGEQVIAVSDTVRRYLLANYAIDDARISVIERGIEPAQWPHGWQPDSAWQRDWRAQYPALAGRRLLLLPGRGTRLKGHADAIVLLADLVRGDADASAETGQPLDCALVLLGADEPGREHYLEQLRQQAAALGVAERLVITPPRADVRAVMALADLVLQLSSRPEAFGRTVIEALALGRPVLGWCHGGVGELLARLYPQGAVKPADAHALLRQARSLMSAAEQVPPLPLSTLALMQECTLALYARLAAERGSR
ncbi:MAG: glycosyltransferase [Xanthomonadales bacterium]|nr:glycosyltransferase [Xanthomonadales bacterium]